MKLAQTRNIVPCSTLASTLQPEEGGTGGCGESGEALEIAPLVEAAPKRTSSLVPRSAYIETRCQASKHTSKPQ